MEWYNLLEITSQFIQTLTSMGTVSSFYRWPCLHHVTTSTWPQLVGPDIFTHRNWKLNLRECKLHFVDGLPLRTE